ncbi:MAG: hypothetical protein K2P78_14615 [Gemmataceae bacterium]|nr:hypothetical protein [Gemmataceae bacterium]
MPRTDLIGLRVCTPRMEYQGDPRVVFGTVVLDLGGPPAMAVFGVRLTTGQLVFRLVHQLKMWPAAV